MKHNRKSFSCGRVLQGLEGACARRWTWRTWRRGHCQGLRVSTSAPAMQGLEVYSTVLWHLRKEVDLAHLAQEAVALDRRSPYAWLALGNCFSLQKVCS